ncbi:MAG TPA: methionyl-tRNA formyltransferase [Pyrinomonadaceae bacterium]|jgi:methionyl-tRNA formyltransferase|nr:methionyl-tRNA formyltransferase [Pyrinomonadaceae bacterium]
MRLIFMGTPLAAVPTLQRCLEDGHEVAAVWTQPDRPAGRGNKLAQSPVKEFALKQDLTVHQPAKIRNEEALALFASHDADAAVVVAYGRILPATFLRAPRRGCINVHFSLLPQYRGAAPVNWAIVRGEKESGVTTMQMDVGLDTGAILLQRRTMIGEALTAPELMSRLSVIGADLLGETLAKLDEISPREQSEEKATFAPVLRREDGLVDWALDAAQIERRVRGFQPWPNVYTRHDSQRLVIWRASVVSDERLQGSAGEIVKAHGDELIVGCGDETLLRLHEVQPEGKRRMSVRDFLNGARVRAGELFR